MFNSFVCGWYTRFLSLRRRKSTVWEKETSEKNIENFYFRKIIHIKKIIFILTRIDCVWEKLQKVKQKDEHDS